MAHPNVETIRKGFEAFMKGDIETARSIFHPNVAWHTPGRSPFAGDLEGFDAIARWGSQLVERSAGSFREELISVQADDKWAFQLTKYHAERKGRRIEDYSWNIFRMVDGRVAESWVGFGDLKSFDDFWS